MSTRNANTRQSLTLKCWYTKRFFELVNTMEIVSILLYAQVVTLNSEFEQPDGLSQYTFVLQEFRL